MKAQLTQASEKSFAVETSNKYEAAPEVVDQLATKLAVPMEDAAVATGAGEMVRAVITFEFPDAPDALEALTR